MSGIEYKGSSKPKRKVTRVELENVIAAFCREIGFHLDLTAPSHRLARNRAIDEVLK